MGYKREPTIYKLKFEDPEFEGLEIRTKSVPLGVFLDMEELISRERPDRETVDKLFRHFAGILVGWNLEDENDIPVPATVEGLYSQDLRFVRVVIDAWREAMVDVPAPLAQASDDGELSPEASIPMEPLSPSQAS
jgi:hypothetical protein